MTKNHLCSAGPRTWNVPDLWQAGKNIKTERLGVSTFDWYLKTDVWFTYGGKYHRVKTGHVLTHAELIMKADLRYAIVVYKSKHGRLYILDGVHRWVKAKILGKKTIKVKIFTDATLPSTIKN